MKAISQRGGRKYSDAQLAKHAGLALKLFSICVVIALAMSSKASEMLSRPRSACDLKFCSPR